MAALAITSSCGSGKPSAEAADFDYTADRFADTDAVADTNTAADGETDGTASAGRGSDDRRCL